MEKLYTFCILFGHGTNICVFHSKLFPADVSQLHTNCPWKQSEQKGFFLEKWFSWSTSEIEQKSKKLVAYCIKFSKNCQNGVLIVQGNKLTKTSLSEEVCFVYHFQIMSGKFSAIWQKFVDRVVKNAFYVPIGKLRWEIVFFGKKIWYFLHPFPKWNEFFRLSFEIFPCRIVTIAYYLCMETIWVERIFIGKMIFLINFQNWAKNYRLLVEIIPRFVKMAF